MLFHVQKVNLCQSSILKLETSRLSYYRNAATISAEPVLQQRAGKTLPTPGIQSNEVHVDVVRASSIRFCKGVQPYSESLLNLVSEHSS